MPQTETQTREEWLAGLKVGDEVAVQQSWGGDAVSLHRIEAANIVCLWVHGYVFSREDGLCQTVSSHYYRIDPATDEARVKESWRKVRQSLAYSLQEQGLAVDSATLEAAIAVLKGEKQE